MDHHKMIWWPIPCLDSTPYRTAVRYNEIKNHNQNSEASPPNHGLRLMKGQPPGSGRSSGSFSGQESLCSNRRPDVRRDVSILTDHDDHEPAPRLKAPEPYLRNMHKGLTGAFQIRKNVISTDAMRREKIFVLKLDVNPKISPLPSR